MIKTAQTPIENKPKC